MLKVKSLSLGYNRNLIIKELNMHIEEGTITTIIGTNGCGKSTVLKSISRTLKPLTGDVYIDGKSVFEIDTKKLAKKLAVLPQGPRVPDDFTTRDLVSYGRYPHLNWMGKLGKEDYEIIDWAIKATKIEHLQHRQVITLSGGERQRAWIAMALAQKPKVLILDEPTTFLDICHQYEILELIKLLNKQMRITIIMVLHDINQAARYSDKIIVIKDGNVFKEGSPKEIISKETLKEVFNIKVKVFEDEDYDCPYFIPVNSFKNN